MTGPSALRWRLDIYVNSATAGLGVDQGGDGRITAQLFQAAAPSRPDASGRPAAGGLGGRGNTDRA